MARTRGGGHELQGVTRELWGKTEMPCFLRGGSYTLSEFLRHCQTDNLYCL